MIHHHHGHHARSASEEKLIRRKLVVVGDGACGKTCMLLAYSKDEFPESYVPTVCETFVKDIQVGQRSVQLVLWDTAGQEDYDRLRPISYNQSDVIIICYCVDNRDSYDNVQNKWIKEVQHFCPGIPIILVGTKLDLRVRDGCVSASEGAELARTIQAQCYKECSAKTRQGIPEVFQAASKEALKHSHIRETTAQHKRCSIL